MGMQLIVYQSHAGSNPAIDARFMGMSANGRRTGFQSVKESSILSIPTRF
jgi:hypothetical protein